MKTTIQTRTYIVEFTPVVLTWEEFSAWRWISRTEKEYDHEDPSFDVDEFSVVASDRVAWDIQVQDSSNNHQRIAAEVLVGSQQALDALIARLTELGINYTQENLTPESSGYAVQDDAGEGAIVYWNGTYWTWEEY